MGFDFIESLPFFVTREKANTADVDANGIWDEPQTDLPKELEYLRTVMQEWTPANRDADDPCDSHSIMLAAACRLLRDKCTPSQALDLLTEVPADNEWTEEERTYKVEEAYKTTTADGTIGKGTKPGDEFGEIQPPLPPKRQKHRED